MVSGYYYDYESAIKNHLKSVSFASYSESLAVRNAMQSGSDGTYTFTDKNGVLSAFDASVKNGSVVSKSGNSLTVQAESGKTAIVMLTQNNVNASGELTGFLTLTNDSKQTLAELQASPRTYYAAVKGLEKFTVEVTKQDSETISAQGDATLSGAVYGLYRDGELLDEYVTDENGCFKTKEYVCGNYTIQEISPSTGYLLDDTVYPVDAEPEHYTLENNSIPLNVEETVIKGNVSILKHSDEDENKVINLEAGAEFEVYLKSAGSYGDAKDSERDDLITDENGYAVSKFMPYGVYTVHQTKTVNDAAFVADFDVQITENGKTYEYVLNDAPFQSYIHVTKLDAETGKAIAYEGAGFQIYDTSGNPVNMGVDTFYTNSEGCLITPESLPYGEYTLVEVQAPMGYVLDDTPVPFSVNAANAEEENAVNIVRVEKTNTAQKGRISVQKTGDSFASVGVASSAYTDENGELVANPTTYTPIFEEIGLAGAVFAITAAEDIVTADGTIRANAGDVVAELVTDENGYAESDLLYLGKYEIKEISAPYGYVLNIEPQTVELTYADQMVAVRDSVKTSFTNDYQGVRISLSKFMEQDELFSIGMNDEWHSVRFGLFADEEMTAADGTAIPENGLICEVRLDETMTAVITEKLPFGRYYVQEIATDEYYVLNGEKYPVNFEYQGQEVTTVNIDCGQFVNDLKRGKVEGIKINESEEPLEDALFGLFAVDTVEFTADNAYMTTVSAENGYFAFTDIPYGKYIVHEIEAPTGYILSDELYPVTIAEDGDIIEITAENQPITVEISKQDVHGNELKGAEMQLIDSKGNVIDEWTSDGKHHVVTELPVGSYSLKEIAAPDGYVIATDIGFEVFADGSVVLESSETTAASDDGYPLVVMVDEATKVQISKQDATTGEKLPGATLQIIDENGKVVEEWISTNAPHLIEGILVAGNSYTLREITAPDGYEIAEDVQFTVNMDGTITEVVMKDAPTPKTVTPVIPTTPTVPGSPATGDIGTNPLAYVLIAAGVLGLVLTIRRKKKGDCPMKRRTILAAVVSTALLCGGMYLIVKNDVAQKIAWNRIKDYAPSPIVRNTLDDAVQIDEKETTINDSIPEIPQEIEVEMIAQVQQLEENYNNSVGWIYVPGTHINYPVMQSGDNEFYLHHAADGSDLYAGSIFLDYRNADFSSVSNILYGHHMNHNSMFADVTKFTDEAYFSGHPYGWLTTKHEVYCVQFFAVDLVESTDGIYNTEANQRSVMCEIVNHAVIYNDIELADTDRLLMLSTCTSANSTSRTVLVGKMIGGDMYG